MADQNCYVIGRNLTYCFHSEITRSQGQFLIVRDHVFGATSPRAVDSRASSALNMIENNYIAQREGDL